MSQEEKDLINLKISISPEKYMTELIKENQSLKKQLEDNKNKYNTRLINQLSENIEPDCEDYYLAEIEAKSNKYDELKNQQKEFIKYLENEIYSYELIKDFLFSDNKKLKIYKEILSKYKEIIGVSNENSKD